MTKIEERLAEPSLGVSIAVSAAESVTREAQERVAQMIAQIARQGELLAEQLQAVIAAGLQAFDGFEETVLELVSLEEEAARGYQSVRPVQIELGPVSGPAKEPGWDGTERRKNARGLRRSVVPAA